MAKIKLSPVQKAIDKYQCGGCVNGPALTCYSKGDTNECSKHVPGTTIWKGGPMIRIIPGLPVGFTRIGEHTMIPAIYVSWAEYQSINPPPGDYSVFNVPVWKHLTSDGHTLVRGLRPRINKPFLDIFLENCMDKINCLEITEEMISKMD